MKPGKRPELFCSKTHKKATSLLKLEKPATGFESNQFCLKLQKMARGFIELPNDQMFSCRWTGYDLIVRIIISELKQTLQQEEHPLIALLSRHVPSSELGDDREMGWGFINDNDECISRIIDLSNETMEYQRLFWNAVMVGYGNLLQQGEKYSDLNPDFLRALVDIYHEPSD